jgi:thiosulfate dehydrogenase (quinone) large subunit
MSDLGSPSEVPLPKAAGLALGRCGLGFLFLFFGMAKLSGLKGFANGLAYDFARTWLPHWLLVTYGYLLPFVEVGLGAMLLLGLARNRVLIATGLLLLSLTFGQILLRQPAVVFQNVVYLCITAGLLFHAEYDVWVLPRWLKAKARGEG